ncbi:uncharacterized protein Tco025E_08413, partial [Trypanosoma conorhini]
SIQRTIHWARQAVVSTQPPVKPRLKRSLDPNRRNKSKQPVHGQQHDRRHNGCQHLKPLSKLRTRAIHQASVGRCLENPLLLQGCRALWLVSPEVRNNRQKVLKKHQHRRLALRLRQHRRQGRGQQMHTEVHKHLQPPKADLARPTPPLPPATMME